MKGDRAGSWDSERSKWLNLPEQLHDIIEIYPAIPIKVERTHWLVRRYPLHLVEHEHDVVEVLAVVGVQVFIEAVAIGIGRGVCETG